MGSFLNFLTFALALLTTTVNGENFSVTSSTEDYYNSARRELLHEIEKADLKYDLDKRFDDFLDIIQYQQQQVLNEVKQVNLSLVPLQALGQSQKYCIQKYESQMISYSAAKLGFDKCVEEAKNRKRSLISGYTNNVDYARRLVTDYLPINLSNICQTGINQTDYLEECYTEHVSGAIQSVLTTLNFGKDYYLDSSRYAVSNISTTAMMCSFEVEKMIFENINATNVLVADCERNFSEKNDMPSPVEDAKPEVSQVQYQIRFETVTIKKYFFEIKKI